MGDVSRVTLRTHTAIGNLKFRVIIFILKVKDSYLKTQYTFLTAESKAFRI